MTLQLADQRKIFGHQQVANRFFYGRIFNRRAFWQLGKTIANGAVPAYGATDTLEMFVLLNNYTVLSFAQLLSRTNISSVSVAP
jgi:hypothetical protein